jgi:hypothetical protein
MRSIDKRWKKINFTDTLEKQAKELWLITGGRNWRWGHLLPRSEILEATQNRKRIFLHRDFRDTLVSWTYHNKNQSRFLSTPEYPLSYEEYKESDDKLLWLLERAYPFFQEMMKWVDIADYVFTYEEIMTNPRKTFKDFAYQEHLNLERMVEKSKERKGRYFRKGIIGGWVNYFEPHHLEVYDKYWRF